MQRQSQLKSYYDESIAIQEKILILFFPKNFPRYTTLKSLRDAFDKTDLIDKIDHLQLELNKLKIDYQNVLRILTAKLKILGAKIDSFNMEKVFFYLEEITGYKFPYGETDVNRFEAYSQIYHNIVFLTQYMLIIKSELLHHIKSVAPDSIKECDEEKATQRSDCSKISLKSPTDAIDDMIDDFEILENREVDYISHLPQEISIKIANTLPLKDLCVYASVNRMNRFHLSNVYHLRFQKCFPLPAKKMISDFSRFVSKVSLMKKLYLHALDENYAGIEESFRNKSLIKELLKINERTGLSTFIHFLRMISGGEHDSVINFIYQNRRRLIPDIEIDHLVWAIILGELPDTINELAKNNFDFCDANGSGLLHYAVFFNSHNLIPSLCNHQQNLPSTQKNKYGISPFGLALYQAPYLPNVSMVSLLLTQNHHFCYDDLKFTVSESSVDALAVLLARINKEHKCQVINELKLSHKEADRDPLKINLLHFTVLYGSVEKAELLLKNGAVVDLHSIVTTQALIYPEYESANALCLATSKANHPMIQLLMRYGADETKLCFKSITSISSSLQESNYFAIVCMMQRYRIDLFVRRLHKNFPNGSAHSLAVTLIEWFKNRYKDSTLKLFSSTTHGKAMEPYITALKEINPNDFNINSFMAIINKIGQDSLVYSTGAYLKQIVLHVKKAIQTQAEIKLSLAPALKPNI